MFQQLLQAIPHTVKKYENTIILDEDDITNKENKKSNNNKAIIPNKDTQMDKETEIYDHNESSIRNIEEVMIENNNNKTTIVNVKCSKCANYEQLIRDKEQLIKKSQHEHNYAHTVTFAKFLDFCNNGGLLSPSLCVFKICMETEKRLDIATDGYTELSVRQLDLKVITEVKNKFALDPSIFPNLQCDNTTISDIPHKIRLLILICSRYIKVRLHSYAKFYLQEIVNPIRKRHRLTKQILFYRE